VLEDVCICNNGIFEVPTSRSTATSSSSNTDTISNKLICFNKHIDLFNHPTFVRNYPASVEELVVNGRSAWCRQKQEASQQEQSAPFRSLLKKGLASCRLKKKKKTKKRRERVNEAIGVDRIDTSCQRRIGTAATSATRNKTNPAVTRIESTEVNERVKTDPAVTRIEFK